MRNLRLITLLLLLVACQRAAPPKNDSLSQRSTIPDETAKACAACHQKQFDEWNQSQHARANRLVDATDRAAFSTNRELKLGSFVTTMNPDGFVIAESFSNRPAVNHRAEMVIGITPLRQYLVAAAGGRWQTSVVAFDPRSNEWFNAQGDENRQPHEWGFWTNRSMTWNVQCAFCHMTGLQKNYDASNDAYRTTWTAMGISCQQCHPMADHPATNGCRVAAMPHIATNRAMENCASCHARREELTSAFKAGEKFDDHYRLTLADAPGIYYADGQIRDEDFEYGSFRMSRMFHKGITCFDCHNPHTGKLKLPADNNALCLQCHTPPGVRGAIAIDIATHSHHALTNSGALCVNCHMPQTKYMVRDPRRDHGFTSPDPQLTIDLQIPNACNRCHADKDAKWANDFTKQWYGDKMNRPSRRRAYALNRALTGDPATQAELLAVARVEEITAWRATFASALAPWVDRADVAAFLTESVTNADPLVRSAAIRSVNRPQVGEQFLNDPTRLVRLDAAWSMLSPGQFPPSALDEVQRYLENVCDQPAGALRRAEFALNLGRTAEAEEWARKAAMWDPSAAPQHALGRILHAVGKTEEGLACIERSVKLAPDDAGFRYDLSLLYGELNRASDALTQLKETVRIEPRFGRAWYNLGLSYAAMEKLDDAITALQKAESMMSESPEPPYARATILLRQKKNDDARAAANAALRIAPDFQAAKQLIESLR